jgi:4-hydroxy-3-methylbut-2-en-1-yl diphosphate synthase IspG/GcpE
MFTSTEIQAMLREMDTSIRRYRKLKNTDPARYRQKLEEENDTLLKELPMVFDMHFNGKLDATFFEMLKMKRKIETGELTEDQASLEVGKKLFSRFVDPIIKGTPVEKPMSYSEFYEQYNKHACD